MKRLIANLAVFLSFYSPVHHYESESWLKVITGRMKAGIGKPLMLGQVFAMYYVVAGKMQFKAFQKH